MSPVLLSMNKVRFAFLFHTTSSGVIWMMVPTQSFTMANWMSRRRLVAEVLQCCKGEHACLLHSLPKLTCIIRRLHLNLGNTTPHPIVEPNFYMICEVYPLPPIAQGQGSTTNPNPNCVVQGVNTSLAHSSSAVAIPSSIHQVGNNTASMIKAEESAMASLSVAPGTPMIVLGVDTISEL